MEALKKRSPNTTRSPIALTTVHMATQNSGYENIALALILGFALTGCNNKNEEDAKHPCYDSTLANDGYCPTDCPRFEGCDGNTYCNECEAARHGIGPK